MLSVFFLSAILSAEPPYVTAERAGVLRLVDPAKATHVSAATGKWADATTWQGGQVPGDGARVIIAAGHNVEIHTQLEPKIKTIRVDGTLMFCRACNTRLWVSTVVVTESGMLDLGAPASPITGQCEIVIPAIPIDITEDPSEFGNGIIAQAPIAAFGQPKTGQADVLPVKVGDKSITLTAAPVNWQAGDKIVIAGTELTPVESFERLLVVSVAGAVVTVQGADAAWQPLAGWTGMKYKHELPLPPAYATGVAAAVQRPFAINLTRNICIRSEKYGYGVVDPKYNIDPLGMPAPEVKLRGHVMLMHMGAESQIQNVEFAGLGRTDKRVSLNTPKFKDGVRVATTKLGTRDIPSGVNQVGRYALHFHRGDMRKQGLAKGCALHNGPGWGLTNHSSNVLFDGCVSFEFVACINTETGAEFGAIRNCAAIHGINTGVEQDGRINQTVHVDVPDQGTVGVVWLQGTAVEVENLKVANGPIGLVLWSGLALAVETYNAPQSVQAGFDPSLFDPAGPDAYMLQFVNPTTGKIQIGGAIKKIDNLLSINAGISLANVEIHQFAQGQPIQKRSKVTRLYEYGKGIEFGYSMGIDLDGGLTDSMQPSLPAGYYRGLRVSGNDISNTIKNFVVQNWGIALVGNNGFNELRDCTIFARNGLYLGQSQSAGFVSASILMPRESHFSGITFIGDTQKLNWAANNFRQSVMDRIIWDGKQLYSANQKADYVPWPEIELNVPDYAVGKTNAQLLAEYGYCMHGDVMPADAALDPALNSLYYTGTPSQRAAVRLYSAKAGTVVRYPSFDQGLITLPSGAVYRLLIEVYAKGNPTPALREIDLPVKPGWQPVVFAESGQKYGVHVFGTGSTPPPEPPPQPPPVNPHNKVRANSYDDAWQTEWTAKAKATFNTPVQGVTKTPGLVIHVGDSMTLSQAYGQWIARAPGRTQEDIAIAAFMHATEAGNANGFNLSGGGVTAFEGMGWTDQRITTMLSDQRIKAAQIAILMMNSPGQSVAIVETRCNQFLQIGVLPVLSTGPPRTAQGYDATVTDPFNVAIAALAKRLAIPLIDFNAEIKLRRPNGTWDGTLIGSNDVHPTGGVNGYKPDSDAYLPGGNPQTHTTGEAALNSGYLLRTWLTAQKVKEIKEAVGTPPPMPETRILTKAQAMAYLGAGLGRTVLDVTVQQDGTYKVTLGP